MHELAAAYSETRRHPLKMGCAIVQDSLTTEDILATTVSHCQGRNQKRWQFNQLQPWPRLQHIPDERRMKSVESVSMSLQQAQR